jgi:hypothetical protein
VSSKILPKYYGQTNVTLYAESNDWEVTDSKQISLPQCNIRNTEWPNYSCIHFCTDPSDFDEGLAFDRSGSYITFKKGNDLIKYQVNGDFTIGSRGVATLPAAGTTSYASPPSVVGVSVSSNIVRSALSYDELVKADGYPFLTYQGIANRGAAFFYSRVSTTDKFWKLDDTFYGTRNLHLLGEKSMQMINDNTLEAVSSQYKYDYIIRKLVSILFDTHQSYFITSLLTYN